MYAFVFTYKKQLNCLGKQKQNWIYNNVDNGVKVNESRVKCQK